MIFKTIEDYDDKINEINQKINKYSEYVKLHPEKVGVKGNIKTLTHVRDELIKEKDQSLQLIPTEELNVNIEGKIVKNHSLPSTILLPILHNIIDLNYALVRALKEGPNAVGKISQEFKDEFCLNIKPFGVGSFNIIFEPSIFSDKQTLFKNTLNKKAFDLFFKILKCENDLNKLSEIHEDIGTYSIVKYRELLKNIYSKELDVTFEEKSKNSYKFFLGNNEAKNIYNSLKGIDEDTSEKVIKKGILVAVDSGRYRFGFELLDPQERIDGKYDESLDDLVSDNFKNLCTLSLLKTNKLNSRSGESKDYWELLDIL